MTPANRVGASAIFKLEGALVSIKTAKFLFVFKCLFCFLLAIYELFTADLLDRELTWNLKVMKKTLMQKLPLSSLEPTHRLYHAHLTVSSLGIEISQTLVFFSPRVCILLIMSLIFLAESNAYHLRVYVYQARNLTALDKDSFSGVIAVLKLLILYVL